MVENILFLTELLGLKVYDLKSRLLGRVKDLALVPLIDQHRIDRFLIGGAGYTWLTVRYDQVKRLSLDGIYLLDEQLTPYHSDEYMLRVVRDLLDQQIIDAQGRKVVRVTDITFEKRRERQSDILWLLEVDIGLR
ncbi:MAG TPA: magnesium transporter, partial [Solibacterales bacterium]|nr:magnesium transporter [Bryobacterales bacterium]